MNESSFTGFEIAIIGMACRFPGAADTEAFWRNLVDGVESIESLSDADLERAGVSRAEIDSPSYVKRASLLDGVELFDAELFGLSPREAEVMDPQHRLFLETAWEAMERAGYGDARRAPRTGVYAASGGTNYLLTTIYPRRDSLGLSAFQLVVANQPDFLATRASYHLGLEGPSLSVQTACSSSLVALHLACRGLVGGECDLALVGGVSIRNLRKEGYHHDPGGVLSPDGYCRPFSKDSEGTIFGNGLGVVVVKRLGDALRDDDTILAVVRGTAVGNDGSQKISYSAPGVEGQSRVVRAALEVSGVEPETIGYVETHGTATKLGDVSEVVALSEAFGRGAGPGSCGLGSVKSNVGHLDTAAGMAGLIKTVLALRHGLLPPTLHFTGPNPDLPLGDGPFYVVGSLREWANEWRPRRAGVSAFGIGGTNAHVVLEEPPEAEPPAPTRPWQLLVLSARSESALEATTERLAAHLRSHPEVATADVAHTLQVGRRRFRHRRFALVGNGPPDQAAGPLAEPDLASVHSRVCHHEERSVVFLLPGQGAQYPGMGRELYEREEEFRRVVDRCLERVDAGLASDLVDLVFAPSADGASAARLRETELAQPALFVVEYALARLWRRFGVRPRAMIGHSLGEWVAGCLAGVFDLDDALVLVALRGRLMQRLPAGAMLAVQTSEDRLRERLDHGLSLAAVNGPSSCVVSGEPAAVAELEARLEAEEVPCRRLETSHAFHSPQMEPILAELRDAVAARELRPPGIPFVSNVSGTWITEEQAVDPAYWASHLRRPVRFLDGLVELLAFPDDVYLEVGPGRALGTFLRGACVRQAGRAGEPPVVLQSISLPGAGGSQQAALLASLGQLWLEGVAVDWEGFRGRERRRRVPLPTYPFERRRYWIDPPEVAAPASRVKAKPRQDRKRSISKWFYAPTWQPVVAPGGPLEACSGEEWLLFSDDRGVGRRLRRELAERGAGVTTVVPGERFERRGSGTYSIDPAAPAHYRRVMQELWEAGRPPRRIYHLWSLVEGPPGATSGMPGDGTDGAGVQTLGFFSLLHMAQALGGHRLEHPLEVGVVTLDLQDVTGDEPAVDVTRSTVLGPAKVIPFEYPQVRCRSVDLDEIPDSDSDPEAASRLALLLLRELTGRLQPVPLPVAVPAVAYRGGERYQQGYEQLPLGPAPAPGEPASRLRRRGTYLITGGLGGIGLELAGFLARRVDARLVLVGRSGLPRRDDWDAWLADHRDGDETSRRIRRLRAIEAEGGQVVTYRADVADLDEMAAAVAAGRERFGPIHGVVHAAGLVGGGSIQLRSREAAEEVLRPKMRGALVLDELFRGAPLDFVVYCSSLAATYGQPGQVAYTAANQFLDLRALHRRRAGGGAVPVFSIGWDAWQDVGMAARMGRPSDDGRPVFTVSHPLLEEYVDDPNGERIFFTRLGVESHWPLAEHRLDGVPVMPASALIEMAVGAFRHVQGGGPGQGVGVELRDVHFTAPLATRDLAPREVQTILRPASAPADQSSAGAGTEFVIRSRPGNGDGSEPWLDHVTGWIARLAAAGADDDRPAQPADRRAAGGSGWKESPRAVFREFGERWKSLRWMGSQDGRELAFVRLPRRFEHEVEGLTLHPALMDLATSFAVPAPGSRTVVLGYDRIVVRNALPAAIYSEVCRRRSAAGGGGGGAAAPRRKVVVLDATLTDEAGRRLVEIEGYTSRKMAREEWKADGEAAVGAGSRGEGSRGVGPRGGGDEADNFIVISDSFGNLDGLRLQPAPRRAPAEREVEVEVAAAGLNFKDVLLALGVIPAPKVAAEAGFGGECAGRVVRVGSAVADFREGDEVIALASPAFSRYTIVDERLVARKPAGASYVEAATVPIAFATAWYGLADLARLGEAERVLIHAASGGVGLAAVQIARHLKAEIFATAGSPEKRAYLRELGIRHVMDSRSLAFAEETLARTSGEGVDVVLNSLAGEFIPAGLGTLRELGRFVELGKRDLIEGAELGLTPFARGLSFFAVDLGLEVRFRPQRVRRLLADVTRLMEDGLLEPLPHQVLPMEAAREAFQEMATVRHIGKIVLELEGVGDGRTATVGSSSGERRPAAAGPDGNERASRAGGFDEIVRRRHAERMELAISPPEGVEVFRRVLARDRAHLLVSTIHRGSASRPEDQEARDEPAPAAIEDESAGRAPAPPELRRYPRPPLAVAFVEPTSATEIRLAALWERILGIEGVGVHDDFFELGGHSLMATHLLGAVRDDIGVVLSISDIFENPTVAQLAQVLEAR